jgi:hypothetical protein
VFHFTSLRLYSRHVSVTDSSASSRRRRDFHCSILRPSRVLPVARLMEILPRTDALVILGTSMHQRQPFDHLYLLYTRPRYIQATSPCALCGHRGGWAISESFARLFVGCSARAKNSNISVRGTVSKRRPFGNSTQPPTTAVIKFFVLTLDG